MPRTTKELIQWVIQVHINDEDHHGVDLVGRKCKEEVIQRLRKYDDLKEIIACGVPQLEEFIRELSFTEYCEMLDNLGVHKK